MNANDVTETLLQIPVGTYIAWICVIFAIISALVGGIVYMYKMFSKYRAVKDEDDSFKELVKKHDRQLEQILAKLDVINEILEEKRKSDLKKLRHSIVRAGEEAVDKGEISIRGLRSLSELFEEYEQKYHANGYVKTLMVKVRALPVMGKLDENDEDIE